MKKKTLEKVSRLDLLKFPNYGDKIIVKFTKNVQLPYEEDVEKYLDDFNVLPWKLLSRKFPGINMKPLITSVPADKLVEMTQTALESNANYKDPQLLNYFLILCPVSIKAKVLVKILRKYENVELAYLDQKVTLPAVIDDDPLSSSQGYLNDAPDGIGARTAWTYPGGDGDGGNITFFDLEEGWDLSHADLPAGLTPIYGTSAGPGAAQDHGTSVLGIVCAVDNAIDALGIVPNVNNVKLAAHNGSIPDIVNAITFIASPANHEFGDILLIEAQHVGGLPVETDPAVYATVVTAVGNDLIVVEPGGDSGTDLNFYTDGLGDFIYNGDRPDSGAIIVSAATSTTPHTHIVNSVHGNRVDCYAWGENVTTLNTTTYGGTFSGTSAAAAIVAGAAVNLQAMMKSEFGFKLGPGDIINLLKTTGTDPVSPVPPIGTMPNLNQLINTYIAPDVYIRDHVGDVGDPHMGSISSSPDVILLSDPVPDPTASFGQGSGTENNNTLGYEAEEGEDNYIYIRAKNRGAVDAIGVTATVYYCQASSLVTPLAWNKVGDITFDVPAGDMLVVAGPITWLQANIPAQGHYCFVCMLSYHDDPAPLIDDITDWNTFRAFIRDENSVTWRNFNVVPNVPDSKFKKLEFLASGADDRDLEMDVETISNLPKGAELHLEIPKNWERYSNLKTSMQIEHEKNVDIDRAKKEKTMLVPVRNNGKHNIGKIYFKARSRIPLRLFVHIPEELRKNTYEVGVRQLYEGQEVGRITWHMIPKEEFDERQKQQKKKSKKK